jgi:LmbE family N-acetylglucosaminyl deacetylase
MNPYVHLANTYARLLHQGRKMPLGGFPPPPSPALPANAPRALVFSPHPDDECITGALPLRLRREAALRVINVAVTFGSKLSRRRARRRELQKACAYLGFATLPAAPSGLERITPQSRAEDRRSWARSVSAIAGILGDAKPLAIFVPHEHDGHDTHIGTHFLILDALAKLPPGFRCWVVETEFWRALEAPNLMVESSPRHVAALMTALTFHAGEVRRNPYHLLLPAWMQDNVRRGAELVGGRGGAAPDFSFATLYRLRRWERGRLLDAPARRRLLAIGDNPLGLFPE